MILNKNKRLRDEYYNALGISNNRVVIHSDLNNFFASVEMLLQPSLNNVAMVICGNEEERHGIVLAKNNKAKKYGIRTGETVQSAREKCRDLVTRPSRYGEYVKFSKAVREIYLRYTPCVEPFGIDEAWLDITGVAGRGEGNLFKNAELISKEIKDVILKEIGLRVSIGVSFNKIFSKLASDMRKNNAVTVISPDNYKNIVGRLPVRDMLYIGKNTEELLKQNRLYTLSDVAKHKRSYLWELFGKNGENIWDFARGIDFSPVASYTVEENTDSVSNSRTLPYDITNIEDGERVLFSLCESVTERIRERFLMCGNVCISIKNSELETVTRQKKMKIHTDSIFDIFSEISFLFRKNVDFSKPIRALGVSLGDFRGIEFSQISIFDIQKSRKKSHIDKVLDKFKIKYGDGTLYPASSLSKKELSQFDKKHPAFNHNL